MKQLKIGDTVIVKKGMIPGDSPSGLRLVRDMIKFEGTVLVITKLEKTVGNVNWYITRNNDWTWSDEFFVDMKKDWSEILK